jgi:hypothetical protein
VSTSCAFLLVSVLRAGWVPQPSITAMPLSSEAKIQVAHK